MIFKVTENKPLEWSRMDCVVVGLTFNQLMIKLRHADRSWRDGAYSRSAPVHWQSKTDLNTGDIYGT